MAFRDWLHALATHQHNGEDGSAVIVNPKFGNVLGGDFVEFDADGGMRMYGRAARYDDLVTSIVSGRCDAENPPTWAPFVGNLFQFQFAINNAIHLGAQELPPGWEEGSEIVIHLHWATGGIDSTDRYVKWEVEFAFAIPALSNYSRSTRLTAETRIPANNPARTHMCTSFGAISIPDGKIGTCIISRVRRIASAGTAPTTNPFALQQGIHIRKDALGSRGHL